MNWNKCGTNCTKYDHVILYDKLEIKIDIAQSKRWTCRRNKMRQIY